MVSCVYRIGEGGWKFCRIFGDYLTHEGPGAMEQEGNMHPFLGRGVHFSIPFRPNARLASRISDFELFRSFSLLTQSKFATSPE